MRELKENKSNFEFISQVSEKAIAYFERASLMQPDDVRWQLMIASCYRRSGNYHRALETYKTIHRRFPENVECLKFLVKLSSDMGLKEAQSYALELKKAERARQQRDERAASSRPGSRPRTSSRTSLNSGTGLRTGSAVSAGELAVPSPAGSRQASGHGRGAVASRVLEEDDEPYRPA